MYIVDISGLGYTHRRGFLIIHITVRGLLVLSAFRETTSLKDDENVN